ncbi:MAG: GtrA family protein [Lachnospiraceae bacterium]
MKNLIEKILKKLFTREMISYLIFGVLTTLVNLVVFQLCDAVLGIYYIAANVIAWIIAVIFAYVTNKLFVFDSKSWELKLVVKEVISFGSARILSLLFETGFIAFTVEVIGMPKFISKIIASIFVVIINYVASKLFIFKKKN